ncbi:sel-1-like protein [Anaeramoeba flamelloides]|uniref:Sel-1-like protein n=1 Tax=Anaeramoeba flamelloides TaxID=1746091 RepID=A0AAV8AC03_9EUKA|nr:sel-1-like protein [Anaeramoeba flamelloides]
MRLSIKLIFILFFYFALVASIPFLLTNLLEDNDSWLLETPTNDIDLELLKSYLKRDIVHPLSNIKESDPKQFEESRSLYQKATEKRESDPNLATYLFKLSASLGNPEAYYSLGEIYLFGNNITKNHNCLAEYYFRKGVSLGHSQSMIALSFVLSTGKCQEEPDQALALVNLHIAADTKKDLNANMILGYRYKEGIGVQRNCQKAIKYYSKVANHVYDNNGDGELPQMNRIHNKKSKFEEQKKKEETKKKESKTVDYIKMATRQDDDNQLTLLGKIYHAGYGGIEKDFGKAIDYYTRASERGNIEAKTNLGNMKLFGTGTEKNYTEAFQLFSEATEGGNAAAMNNLAVLFQNGMGTEKNLTMSCRLLKNASKKGLALAQYSYALFLLNGHGCEKNVTKSFKYFKKAADQDHMASIILTAQMYNGGEGTGKSCENALEYYKKIAERGEWADDFKDAYQYWNNGDLLKSILIYEQLAEFGYEIAQSNVANLYYQMANIKDMKKIFNGNLKLIDKDAGADGSPPLSAYDIKDWLDFQRKNRVLSYYYLSGNQNNSNSLNKVAKFYFDGFGVEKDVVKSFKTYQRSSSLNNSHASYQIGKFYELGLAGLEKDYFIAKKYYDQALSFDKKSFFIMGFVYLKWGVFAFINHPLIMLKRVFHFKKYFLILSTFLNLLNSSASIKYHDTFKKDFAKKMDTEIYIIIISLALVFAFFGLRAILKKTTIQNNDANESDHNNNNNNNNILIENNN